MKKVLRLIHDYLIIRRSGLFDAGYYLKKNPDVRHSDIDPLLHFIKHGWQEDRDPNSVLNISYYLEQNQDVKNNQINPLVHYIRYGKIEGRKPNRHFAADQIKPNLEDVKPINKKSQGEITGKIQGADAKGYEIDQAIESIPMPEAYLLTSSELSNIFIKAALSKKYIISLSHDNYLRNTVGGVQVYIANEQKNYNDENISYIHIFPQENNESLSEDNQNFMVCVNLDGTYLGLSESQTVISALKFLETFELLQINIHHTMGFSLSFLNGILDLNKKRGNFWIHDYFSLCPSYHLLRNGVEYCGAPDIKSNACLICKYSDKRKIQIQKFSELFNTNELEIYAPSEFAISFWHSKFPIRVDNYQIKPPAHLKWIDNSQQKYSKGPVRVGYIGLPLPKKGWNTWIRLTNQFTKSKSYEFFHFSSMTGSPGRFQRIHTEVTPMQPDQMIDNLNQYNIDVAFLWSVVPETFSFTLHEALAAGCFVITNRLSGNIQDYLRKNPQYGLVLDNENELTELFLGEGLIKYVKTFQKDGKPQAKLLRFGDRR